MIARLRGDGRILPILAFAVVVFGLFAGANATWAQAGTYAAIYACAAIGLSVLLGNTAQISIGQAGFFGIGAYTVAFLTTLPAPWPWWAAAPAGVAMATLAGVAVGFVALRFRGHYLAMATLAFALIAQGIFHEAKFLGGAIGITSVPFAQFGPLTISNYAAYWFAWALALAVAALTLNLLRGRTGRAWEAIRNDELAAEVAGVPVRRYKIVAFAYAAALAGLAGTVYAAYLGIVVPEAVGVPLSIDILLMVVLGGAGGVSGALVGATLIGVLDIAGHQYENWREVAYGAVVIGVVILAPRGLLWSIVRPESFAKRSLDRAALHAAVARAPQPPVAPPAAGIGPLDVDAVSKRFGGLLAVNAVSFSLERGTLTSLIGPNGAGKTTLFNAICGVGRLDGGAVRIAGHDVAGWRPHRVAALGVGRTFQNARLFGEMTVLENVMAGAFRAESAGFADDLLGLARSRRAEREARERVRQMLIRLDLEPLAATYARDLPFGARRRVELARAIAADPWLLLVDEPAAGLNASERARLHDDLLALRASGVTLLLIEHDMKLVMSLSDRVLVLKFGRLIADGPPPVVQNDPEVIAAYLGTEP